MGNGDTPLPRQQADLMGTVDDTRAFPVVSDTALLQPRDSAELAGVLLPQETAVLSSSPHPIVWIRPALRLLFGSVVLIALFVAKQDPIIAGHHRTVALMSTDIGRVVAALVGAFALVQFTQLSKQLSYYFGFRVIATNRRVFVIRSLLDRSIRPLGNTGMARSSLSQGVLGRILDFGTIRTGEGTLRDMRYPVALWRSLEAVAHGVENGQWKPAIRSTLIP